MPTGLYDACVNLELRPEGIFYGYLQSLLALARSKDPKTASTATLQFMDLATRDSARYVAFCRKTDKPCVIISIGDSAGEGFALTDILERSQDIGSCSLREAPRQAINGKL